MGSDPPDRQSDGDGAVRPEELDFTSDDSVAVLDEGRYVVATEGTGPPDPEATGAGDGADRDPAELLNALCEHLEEVDPPHGFAVATRVDGDVDRRAVLADDLADMFEELVTWFSGRIDEETPPEAVIGILLLASGRSVRYPAETLDALVTEHGLSYDDSIGDLVDRVGEDGLSLPPTGEEGDR